MSAIKDLYDLVTDLIKSTTDRKFATELGNVQSLISSAQSEHFDARERNVQLLADNVRLQQQIHDAEAKHSTEMKELQASHTHEVAALQKSHSLEMAKLQEENTEMKAPKTPIRRNRMGTPQGY